MHTAFSPSCFQHVCCLPDKGLVNVRRRTTTNADTTRSTNCWGLVEDGAIAKNSKASIDQASFLQYDKERKKQKRAIKGGGGGGSKAAAAAIIEAAPDDGGKATLSLKDENAELKDENAALKRRIAELEGEADAALKGGKKGRKKARA